MFVFPVLSTNISSRPLASRGHSCTELYPRSHIFCPISGCRRCLSVAVSPFHFCQCTKASTKQLAVTTPSRCRTHRRIQYSQWILFMVSPWIIFTVELMVPQFCRIWGAISSTAVAFGSCRNATRRSWSGRIHSQLETCKLMRQHENVHVLERRHHVADQLSATVESGVAPRGWLTVHLQPKETIDKNKEP